MDTGGDSGYRGVTGDTGGDRGYKLKGYRG